jgi:GT2 family glycosyltransferase
VTKGSEASGAHPRQVGIAVIVLTVDQRESTLRCLQTILEQDAPSFRVVLWDNGSRDGTVEAVREAHPEVLVHAHPENLGVASGRNAAAALAIEHLAPEYLLFLDNDMEVAPGFIRGLLAPLETDPTVGQTQAKLRFLDDRERLNDGGGCRISFWRGSTHPVGCGEIDRGQYDQPAPCIACGGAMMTRTSVFQELGGFDPAFGPVGPEDLDYSLRLQKAGYRALYAPQAMAYHAVSHTFGGGRYTEAYARHKARNWFHFMLRHAPVHQKLVFLFVSAPVLALRLLVREGRRGNLGAVRGVLRGMSEFVRSKRGATGASSDD